jgi:hypothetical protein
MQSIGLPESAIVKFYRILRQYKDHDKALELLKNHYLFKVQGRMTVKEFNNWVEDVINHHLNNKKG